MINSNIRILERGIDVLQQLGEGLYSKPEPRVCSGGIGAQLRHCLDFYQCFLRGLQAGRIDYDARDRDKRIENEPTYAIGRMRELIASLGDLALPASQTELNVSTDSDGDTPPSQRWARSSIERELQFLRSHTVHHFAIIAVILRLNGVDPGPEFGIAPSTLAYQRSNSTCAH